MAKLPLNQLSSVVANLSTQQVIPEDKLATNIAAYLLEEHRANDLDSLIREVQQDWADQGYVDIIARVARPIDEQLQEELANSFRGLYKNAKHVKVTIVIDESVIGGVVLELGQQRLDISVRHRLNNFKNAINERGN